MLRIEKLPYEGDPAGGDEIAIISDGITTFVAVSDGFDYGSSLAFYSANVLDVKAIKEHVERKMSCYDLVCWIKANLVECR